MVDKLVEFWDDHKSTLIPFLTDFAIAALEALVAARSDISSINLPGPN
jgi:hypothetical protein